MRARPLPARACRSGRSRAAPHRYRPCWSRTSARGRASLRAETLEQRGAHALEFLDQRGIERRGIGELDALRIDEAAVDVILEVQVRAGRKAGHADIADGLALLYVSPGSLRREAR